MFWLIVSVSDSVSFSVWRPTTARSVVWAIWLIGGLDVLDRDHRPGRILDPVVGHRGHVDADVVLGDDPLGLDRHRDDPQRHPMNAIDEWHDEDRFLDRAPGL